MPNGSFTAAMNMAQASLLECTHLYSMAPFAIALAALPIHSMYCLPTVSDHDQTVLAMSVLWRIL